MITDVMDYNKKVVAEYTAAKEDIEQKRDDLQNTQDSQKEYQKNLSYKVDELAASEAEQAALQESLEAYKAESEEEYDRIASEMQDVSNQIAELSRQSAANGSVPMGDGTLIWPTPSCTTTNSAYGYRVHPIYGTVKFHAGEDIPAGYGAQILAAASGTVVTAGWVSGYGNYTVIDHGGGLMTAYGHQSSFAVSVGDVVTQGQVIGYVGSTGNSTGPHLHFEVYVNGSTVGPEELLLTVIHKGRGRRVLSLFWREAAEYEKTAGNTDHIGNGAGALPDGLRRGYRVLLCGVRLAYAGGAEQAARDRRDRRRALCRRV